MRPLLIDVVVAIVSLSLPLMRCLLMTCRNNRAVAGLCRETLAVEPTKTKCRHSPIHIHPCTNENKKDAEPSRRSSGPRQGASRNGTWPASLAGRGLRCLLSGMQEPMGIGSGWRFRMKQYLTLARRSNCVHRGRQAVLMSLRSWLNACPAQCRAASISLVLRFGVSSRPLQNHLAVERNR